MKKLHLFIVFSIIGFVGIFLDEYIKVIWEYKAVRFIGYGAIIWLYVSAVVSQKGVDMRSEKFRAKKA